MTPRLSGHFSIIIWFGFLLLKSLLGIARQGSLEKFAIFTLKPRSRVRILTYRTWAFRPIIYRYTTGKPGSEIVPQYGSCKITAFVLGKNTILTFLGNTKKKSMKLTLQLIVVVLIAPTKFRDNLQ